MRRGVSLSSETVRVHFLPARGKKLVGFTTSRRVGSAVRRNRMRRLLKERVRKALYRLSDGDYGFVAKTSSPSVSLEALMVRLDVRSARS